MNPLNLIPDKYLLLVKLGAIALAVVIAVVWWNAHNAGQQRIGYDRAMGEVAAEQQKLADAQREREDVTQTAINQEAENAQNAITDLERQRDLARVDADRMRSAYRDAAARARGQGACTAAAGPGEQGADTLGLFADLLIRADREAEAVASYADQLRIAGLACERSYDAVKRE